MKSYYDFKKTNKQRLVNTVKPRLCNVNIFSALLKQILDACCGSDLNSNMTHFASYYCLSFVLCHTLLKYLKIFRNRQRKVKAALVCVVFRFKRNCHYLAEWHFPRWAAEPHAETPPAGPVTSLGAENKAQNQEERRDGGYFKTYSGFCQALVKRKAVKNSETIRLPLINEG